MSLKRAFKGFFSNPDWLKKSALGMLGVLVPYVGAMVVMGYGIEYMRGVAWRGSDTLPEWRSLERYLKTGFFAFVVSLVYMLPVYLVMALAFGVSFSVLFTASSPEQVILPVMLIVTLLVMPFTLLASVFVQAGVVRFAAYDTIGEGLKVREVWATTLANRGPFWGALWRVWIMGLGLGGFMALGYMLVYGSFIGAAFTQSDAAILAAMPAMYCGQFLVPILGAAVGVLMQLISYHLWGQYLAVAHPRPQFEVAPQDPTPDRGAGHEVLPDAPGQTWPTAQPPAVPQPPAPPAPPAPPTAQ